MTVISPKSKRQLFVLALAVCCLVLVLIRANTSSARELIGPNLVKVMVTSNPWDPESPWQKLGSKSATGTGVIIEGQRILTNAHVVADQVNIQVKRSGTTKTYGANVLFVSHECDLALLTVESPEFFQGVEPLPFGALPKIRDHVEVHGFAVGGETVSVTAGIVSRIEVGMYAHSFLNYLLIQVDAAINPGNSGGPVTSGRSMVGIATQSMGDAENVGYIVPAPVIRHFLDDTKDGRLDGFPALSVTLQGMESESHRQSLGMSNSETGALVTEIDFGGTAWGALEVGDVLLSIDGHEVANDRTVALTGMPRVDLACYIQSKQVGSKVDLYVLHAGEHTRRQATLKERKELVPGFRYDSPPTYMVFGGLVFQPLDITYLRRLKEIPGVLDRYAWNANIVTPERQQVILINKVLADQVNEGYQDWVYEIVTTVDGVVPRDMAHLASIIDEAKGPWLRIRSEDNWMMALDLAAARRATPVIVAKYGIHDDRSEDLRLAAKPSQAVAGGNVD